MRLWTSKYLYPSSLILLSIYEIAVYVFSNFSFMSCNNSSVSPLPKRCIWRICNGMPVETGYSEYDEEFRNQYVDCLGNYLLLSKSHNCSVGNRPFAEKRASYNHLAQQREIQDMTPDGVWDKEKIAFRKEKLIKFILTNF